jgi:Uma2 family endonuclease
MAVRVINPARPRLLTVEEWASREDAEQYELIDGLLRERMVNQNQHEFAVGRLAYVINAYLLGSNTVGDLYTSNTKYRVRGRRGIMPDVSVILGAKAAQLDRRAAYNAVGPDLAVEVLSPEQGADYIDERLDDYWKLGTEEVWIVDPEARTVSGYSRQPRDYTIFGQAHGTEEFQSQLLPGLQFSLGLLWQPR